MGGVLVGMKADFGKIQFNYRDIDLIVYDFDGVMTDNCVIIFQYGTKAVIVNRADGLGVDSFRGLGILQRSYQRIVRLYDGFSMLSQVEESGHPDRAGNRNLLGSYED